MCACIYGGLKGRTIIKISKALVVDVCEVALTDVADIVVDNICR